MFAEFGGGKIEEAEAHRLFDLVYERRCNHDVRDVGLDKTDLFRLVRKKSWIEHCLKERREVAFCGLHVGSSMRSVRLQVSRGVLLVFGLAVPTMPRLRLDR
jgi:tRNA(Leu) C34 or U34 (ribose-2'-O)-methylase TrmL